MVLILRTQGGFCSRIRAIVSGILWAEDLDRKLVLYWPVEPGYMPCNLGEILVEESIPRLCCAHAGYISKAHAVQSPEDMRTTLRVFGADALEIRIESYSSFHPDANGPRGRVVLRQLQISPKISKLAQDSWTAIGGKSLMVGVHFRGTDFHNRTLRDGKNATTLPEILAAMHKEPKDTQFCFVTDEPEAAAEAVREFPGRLFVPTDEKGRIKSGQQLIGVVDWLLLQKCCRIIGSRGSSFNEEAARRSGMELIIPEQLC